MEGPQVYMKGRGLVEAVPAPCLDRLPAVFVSFLSFWMTVRDMLAHMLISQRSQVSALHLRVMCPHMVILCDPFFSCRDHSGSIPSSPDLSTCSTITPPAGCSVSEQTETAAGTRATAPSFALPLYLLLTLRLSSFFSFSYSASLWTANRISWG